MRNFCRAKWPHTTFEGWRTSFCVAVVKVQQLLVCSWLRWVHLSIQYDYISQSKSFTLLRNSSLKKFFMTDWWKYQVHLSSAREVAMTVNSLLATEANVEPLFSALAIILTQKGPNWCKPTSGSIMFACHWSRHRYLTGRLEVEPTLINSIVQ